MRRACRAAGLAAVIGAAAAFGAVLAAPTPALARAAITYAGEEAAALRCANMLALTAVALSRHGLIAKPEKEIMLGISVLILDHHVSGSWPQKKAALKIMRDRRGPAQTLEDYQRNAARCLRQFPIN